MGDAFVSGADAGSSGKRLRDTVKAASWNELIGEISGGKLRM
jgi:hypothetical protein